MIAADVETVFCVWDDRSGCVEGKLSDGLDENAHTDSFLLYYTPLQSRETSHALSGSKVVMACVRSIKVAPQQQQFIFASAIFDEF